MTTPGKHEAFMRAFEEQRRQYAGALPDRLEALGRLWEGVAAGTATPDALELLTRAAHGLAGSGAVFGYGALGAEARAIELELRDLPARHDGRAGPPPERIGAAIARLRRLVDPA